jgi:hypothetical protein
MNNKIDHEKSDEGQKDNADGQDIEENVVYDSAR